MPQVPRLFSLSKMLCVLAVGLCCALSAFAQNGPPDQDLSYELGIYYTAKKGETLAEIARRFFDSETYWPQLWKDNDHIRNPYSLKEGERIRLYHTAGSKKIPLALIARPLPETEAPFALFSPIDAVGFVRPEPVPSLGSLFKVTGNKALIAQGDEVFLRKRRDDAFEAGTRYRLFRVSPIPGSPVPPGLGVQHLITGVVEVTDVKPDYAVATVIQSYRRIHIDDRVMPYTKRSPVIPLVRCQKGLHGTLAASEEKLTLMGEGHIAFIDKGRKDGVAPGQQYLLCEKKTRIKPDTGREVTVGPIDFGTLLVLVAEERASTVVITQSDRPVAPGDGFRAPSLME